MKILRSLCLFAALPLTLAPAHDLPKLERSFWLNASLAVPKLGYWGTNFPPPASPTTAEITNAARTLIQQANPNRLYLIHHHELPFAKTARIFRDWRTACPATVEIIPALVLRLYDKPAEPVFSAPELDALITFFKTEVHPTKIAVYDVLPKRDQGQALATLAKNYPQGLLRIGLQPDEPLEAPYVGAVEDTWSGFCHGLTNEDWQEHGFGRETLRKWVSLRNEQAQRIAYDLIVVAWDYANTKRGEYPGYDDAHKNLPLPAERNRLAAREILALAKPGTFAGFSADLLIIELNSETAVHDGEESFYTTLKAGKPYDGFYANPWRELCDIFQALSAGRTP
ncbi:MAG: hypothetical protein IAE77_15560 [Prosthecobacter sp.]|jgi:hypothetical protein|uniref:hypothetical protein n=1 Tax=Prosthecobacter sp. TaxID=1965333 RepID=UPI0019E34C71|nr:hypothetical protein [Prosthecobacter sp.]MBE2284877.1 hypothetical protein [Prosthecobacter sp.]